MAAMNGRRWVRASLHLDRALDLETSERDACLAILRKEELETQGIPLSQLSSA